MHVPTSYNEAVPRPGHRGRVSCASWLRAAQCSDELGSAWALGQKREWGGWVRPCKGESGTEPQVVPGLPAVQREQREEAAFAVFPGCGQ